MERRLRISAHIPLQPLSRISAAKEKSCAKGLFDEKYNNNPKQRWTRGYKRYKETSGLIEWKECQIFHSIFT